MEYQTIKLELSNLTREIARLKRVISETNLELTKVQNKSVSDESNYQERRRQAETEACDKFVESKINPLEEKISKLETEKSDTEQLYNQRMLDLDDSKVSTMYTGEEEMLSDVKAALAVLQRHLEKKLSKRFKSELDRQLDSGTITIAPKELPKLIRYFNRQSEFISKLNETNKVNGMLSKIDSLCLENPFAEKGDPSKVQVGGLLLIGGSLVLIAAKITFPIYLSFLMLYSVYNVHVNYQVYSALVTAKVVSDNVAAIDEDLQQKALASLKAERDKLTQQHLSQMAVIDNKITQVKIERDRVLAEAKDSFVFDDEALEAAHNAEINANDRELDNLNKKLETTKGELEEKQSKMLEFKSKLDSAVETLVEEYVSETKIGSDCILDPNFLFDIENGKPKFLVYPETSCLFLYEEKQDIIDFIKLITVQLRGKLNPFNFHVSLLNPPLNGLSLRFLDVGYQEKNPIFSKLFKINVHKEDITEENTRYVRLLETRAVEIMSTFNSFKEYNQFMLENDSLTSSYEFVFWNEPDFSALNETSMENILEVGGQLGIFYNVCIPKSEFLKGKENAQRVLSKIGKIFEFVDGKYFERAKDFILDEMKSLEVKTEKNHS